MGSKNSISGIGSCQCYIRNQESDYSLVEKLIQLEDGRGIAYTDKGLILLGKLLSDLDTVRNRMVYLLKDHVVIAEGIEQLLERIFQAEGRYYFDAPSFEMRPQS